MQVILGAGMWAHRIVPMMWVRLSSGEHHSYRLGSHFRKEHSQICGMRHDLFTPADGSSEVVCMLQEGEGQCQSVLLRLEGQ